MSLFQKSLILKMNFLLLMIFTLWIFQQRVHFIFQYSFEVSINFYFSFCLNTNNYLISYYQISKHNQIFLFQIFAKLFTYNKICKILKSQFVKQSLSFADRSKYEKYTKIDSKHNKSDQFLYYISCNIEFVGS